MTARTLSVQEVLDSWGEQLNLTFWTDLEDTTSKSQRVKGPAVSARPVGESRGQATGSTGSPLGREAGRQAIPSIIPLLRVVVSTDRQPSPKVKAEKVNSESATH